MKKRKSENADDKKQIADDTKQIADDTKQIEDDTKQNCGMKTYEIRKPVMNRNLHEEERRKVEEEMTSERIGWIESFVGQICSLVSCVRWSN
ncbi:Light-independent protochlorophyllide reductase subunit [Trichinella pseudospiralis]